MSDLVQYINNLELSGPDGAFSFPSLAESGAGYLESTEGDSGLMNFRSLCSFASGISGQRQEDVLNSLLLAQRVATKAFPDDDQIMDWYRKYFDVLDRIGWIFENRDFSTFETKTSLFHIEKAILEILGTALSQNQLAVIMKTVDAFKALGGDDKRFIAFEKNTHTLYRGCFQLGVAAEENSTLSVSASAFALFTEKKISQILFFSSQKEVTEFKFCASKATLNDGVFKDARETIREKLGDVSGFVAALDL